MFARRSPVTGYAWLPVVGHLVAALLTLGPAAPGRADSLFPSAFVPFEVGLRPFAVAIADFNVDGRADLAVANLGSNTVAVLLGNGDGTFASKTEYGTGDAPFAIAVADWNADGRPDLAVANLQSNTASVLLGHGDGSFAARIDIPTGVNPLAVGSADFDADGEPDLAVLNQGPYPDYPGTVSVFHGNGDGTFGPATAIVTGVNPCSMVLADLDGDGHPDLTVLNRGAEPDVHAMVAVLLGRPDGTFEPRPGFPVQPYAQAAAIADLDADGRPDLIVALGRLENTVSVLLGNGDGTFAASADFEAGKVPFAVAIADLNGDGRQDLAAAHAYSGTISVLLGNGDGTFAVSSDFGAGTGAFSIAIADLNGDGRADLAATSDDANTVSVLVGNGDGTFGDPRAQVATGAQPASVAIGDLDADGRPDLAVANAGGPPDYVGTVSVMLGKGGGAFASRTDIATGSLSTSLAIADLNADAWPDLAVANNWSNTVSVLLGNGDGTFAAMPDLGSPSPRAVAIADLNADGRLDLVALNYLVLRRTGSGDDGDHPPCWGCPPDPGSVSIFLGNGDGTFVGGPGFGTGDFPSALAIADLNADGRPDLVIGNARSWLDQVGTVSVQLGNGDGTFGDKVDFVTGAYPTSLTITDWNEDGRPDLGVARSAGASVLLGNGDGTFATWTGPGTLGSPFAIASADLDADGHQDLAVTCAFSNSITVLLGDGDGGSGSQAVFGTRSTPASVAIADFDANGMPDLAVANSPTNSVSILLNRGTPPSSIAVGFNVAPAVLHVASRARWVTGFLEPPAPFAAAAIDVASIRLNGTVAVDPAAPTAVGDRDGNGIPDLMVKFPRAAVELAVAEGDDVALIVSGMVDGQFFSGTGHIRVLGPGAGGHRAGASGASALDQARPALAIRSTSPGPSIDGRLRVEFVLRDGSPARLDVVDIVGRVVVASQVGDLGPGAHALQLTQEKLRPGIYFLRLRQGHGEVRGRMVVVR